MTQTIDKFLRWIEEGSRRDPYFTGTFWFLLSALPEGEFARVLELHGPAHLGVPVADSSTTVSFSGRSAKTLHATFWHLPFVAPPLRLLFSLEKAYKALRPMYKLLNRAGGKVHLFPMGHRLVKSCVRLNSKYSFEQTYVVRGVSYPSRPNEGGADINLKPGNAATFFARLEDERRILKSARMRAPTRENGFCEFTVSRLGYLAYHKGGPGNLLELILGRLPEEMLESVRPFQQARGKFVGLRFPEPVFTDQASYKIVLQGLSRLPRSSVALLHANPYFHATLTNYEDGGEFDIFITDPTTLHIQGRGEASAASFLRLHNNLAELFRDADITLEKPATFRLRDLIEGRV